MTRKEELIEAFEAGDMHMVEFLELALDLPDFSIDEITETLKRQSEEDLGDRNWRHGL